MNTRPKTVCSVDGCEKFCVGRGFCKLHWRRFMKTGDPSGLLRRANGEGSVDGNGYRYFYDNGTQRREHIIKAEKAIGKPLPKGALVHHADCNPSNNANGNLVVCPSQAYHQLLHRRTRALDACGHVNWLKCCLCKQYGPPGDVVDTGRQLLHRQCAREYAATWRKLQHERKAA